ncbi:hypothetical protein BDW66DRAFT_153720 [Aspergillus desertorum]
MPCTTHSNICPSCLATLLFIQRKYPESTITPMKATIYPVSFRAAFPESEVPFDYAVRVADAIKDTVLEVFGNHVSVLAYSNFESQPRAGSEIWVSVLIEFPVRDKRMIKEMSKGVAGELEGWECLLPRGDECPGTFWLRWHENPMGM